MIDLGSLMEAAVGLVEPVDVAGVRGRVDERRHERRRARSLAGVTGVALLLVAGLAWGRSGRTEQRLSVVAPGATSLPTSASTAPPSTGVAEQATAEVDRWRRTASWPAFGPPGTNGLGREGFTAVAATIGDRRVVLVWGGTVDGGDAFADGATFDPASTSWTWMPAAPLAARSGHVSVWTGSEMLIWGGGDRWSAADELRHADGAAFDPAGNRWRSIAPSPLVGGSGYAAAWTGTEMVVVGGPGSADDGTGQRPVLSRRAAAYDPLRDSWRELPDLPFDLSFAKAHWTGTEVLVAGGQSFTTNDVVNLRGPTLAASLDPRSGQWREAPLGGPRSQSIDSAWVDGRLIVVTYDPSSDPGGAWTPGADAWTGLDGYPLTDGCEDSPVVVAVNGGAVAAVCGNVARFDADSRTWSRFRPPTSAFFRTASTVFTGAEVVSIAGDGSASIMVP